MRLKKQVKKLQEAIVDQERRYHMLMGEIKTLTDRVSCGEKGHGFHLMSAWVSNFYINAGSQMGQFRCGCGAEIVRKLSKSEIAAARKLGFLKEVSK